MVQGSDSSQLAGGWRLAHELTSRQREEVIAVRSAEAELARVIGAADDERREHARVEAEATAARTQLAAAIRERRELLVQVREQEGQRTQAIEELERAGRELGDMIAGSAARGTVTLDVHRFKGLLEAPADGPVLRGFGDRRDARFGTVVPHRGWDIGAPHGAEVHAIFDGRVVWASWFRGYGLMVVVDHGHGVHSVYAHLSVITAQNGSEVQKGQSLGRVGDTGSLTGPLLYLEIREGGRAEDPAGWLRQKP